MTFYLIKKTNYGSVLAKKVKRSVRTFRQPLIDCTDRYILYNYINLPFAYRYFIM